MQPAVYSSNKAVLAENVGRRQENFFWRIWSSERIRQRLSGTQVNRLFDVINEGGYIRTTPKASPRSSKNLSAYYIDTRLQATSSTPPDSAETSKRVSSSTLAGSASHVDRAAESSVTLTATGVPATVKGSSGGELSAKQRGPGKQSIPPRESSLALLEKLRKVEAPAGYRSSEDNSLTPTPTSPLAALEQSNETLKENRRTSYVATRRPPILKKGSSGSSRSSQSGKAAFLAPGAPQVGAAAESGETVFDDDEDGSTVCGQTRSNITRRPTATRFNEEVAVSIPKVSSSFQRTAVERSMKSGESGQRSGKRNPVVVASTRANKTKPSFVRQRSSLGTSKEVPSRSTSSQNLAKSPKAPSTSMSEESDLESRQSRKGSPKAKARAVSPHPSKQRSKPSPDIHSNESPSEVSPDEQEDAEGAVVETAKVSRLRAGPSGDQSRKQLGESKVLVEPDFRAKFLDRTRVSQRSLTDLSALSRKSTAAVPTAASFQAAGMMESVQTASSAGRGRGKEAFTNVTAPLKAPAPEGPKGSETDASMPLPRTKSQLTLLLEKEKARSSKGERG